MDEQQRPEDRAHDAASDAERGTHVIEPDSELGRAMTRAREQWIEDDPAETIGVDEEAIRKAVAE